MEKQSQVPSSEIVEDTWNRKRAEEELQAFISSRLSKLVEREV